ncbi:hypothetical protein GOP47_0003473, partial [Adiantum capillus-veneris]
SFLSLSLSHTHTVNHTRAHTPPRKPMQTEEKDIRELKLESNKGRTAEVDVVLQQILKLERRIFPKHESLASTMQLDLKKKNLGVLFAVDHHPCNVDEQHTDTVCVAGYVIYSFTSSLAASIVKLAVRECYRKQGYGQALLKAAIVKCQTRPICRVTLHVDPTREAAMGLYKKMGFRTDTIVLDYYAPRRDAHRMFIDFDKP